LPAGGPEARQRRRRLSRPRSLDRVRRQRGLRDSQVARLTRHSTAQVLHSRDRVIMFQTQQAEIEQRVDLDNNGFPDLFMVIESIIPSWSVVARVSVSNTASRIPEAWWWTLRGTDR